MPLNTRLTLLVVNYCHRNVRFWPTTSTHTLFSCWNPIHAFWVLKSLKWGGCHPSNTARKQKLRASAKYSAEWETSSLVHRKVPVSLTACGHCKLSHNQSSAATSLWTKKLSLPSPPGLSRESTACRLSRTVISEKGGKHIAWLTHHNLEGKMNPPSCTWGEERSKGKSRGEGEWRVKMEEAGSGH